MSRKTLAASIHQLNTGQFMKLCRTFASIWVLFLCYHIEKSGVRYPFIKYVLFVEKEEATIIPKKIFDESSWFIIAVFTMFARFYDFCSASTNYRLQCDVHPIASFASYPRITVTIGYHGQCHRIPVFVYVFRRVQCSLDVYTTCFPESASLFCLKVKFYVFKH